MTNDEKTAKIQQLKSQMDAVDAEYHRLTDPLREKMQTLEAELDQFKTKCPTCRCRLLPEEVCQCCDRRQGLVEHLQQEFGNDATVVVVGSSDAQALHQHGLVDPNKSDPNVN